MTSAIYRRVTQLGFLTTQDLQALFDVCDETVHNAVKRGDLPPPVKLFGRNVWSVESLKQHLEQRLETARVQAEREQAQKEAKVQALHGGDPHGRRS
jgi:predicted DNA-binding transcriptional regulator AlpA